MSSKLVHGLDTLADFKRIDLIEPLDSKDIDVTLEALKAKKQYFDTLPRPSKFKAGQKCSTVSENDDNDVC